MIQKRMRTLKLWIWGAIITMIVLMVAWELSDILAYNLVY
jgi:hypothetical protein